MQSNDGGLDGLELKVRVASVVIDPDGEAAVLALAPASRSSTPLVHRSPTAWATVVVYVSSIDTSAAFVERLADASMLHLNRVADGIRLRGEDVDHWFLLAALPENPVD